MDEVGSRGTGIRRRTTGERSAMDGAPAPMTSDMDGGPADGKMLSAAEGGGRLSATEARRALYGGRGADVERLEMGPTAGDGWMGPPFGDVMKRFCHFPFKQTAWNFMNYLPVLPSTATENHTGGGRVCACAAP